MSDSYEIHAGTEQEWLHDWKIIAKKNMKLKKENIWGSKKEWWVEHNYWRKKVNNKEKMTVDVTAEKIQWKYIWILKITKTKNTEKSSS